MLKYFSQHLMKFFMPRDSFSETTVTPNDPSSEIFNYFQNIIFAFLEKIFLFLENILFFKQDILTKYTTQSNIIDKMHSNNDIKLKI